MIRTHQIMEETFAYLFAILTENLLLSVLLFVVVLLTIQTAIISIRLGRLMKGGDGKSLEGLIQKLNEQTARLEAHAKETTVILKETDERLLRSVQGTSVKRFDPFQNSGGQQSF